MSQLMDSAIVEAVWFQVHSGYWNVTPRKCRIIGHTKAGRVRIKLEDESIRFVSKSNLAVNGEPYNQLLRREAQACQPRTDEEENMPDEKDEATIEAMRDLAERADEADTPEEVVEIAEELIELTK